MNMRMFLLAMLIAPLFSTTNVPAAAEPARPFSITDLGTHGGLTSRAEAINERGQVIVNWFTIINNQFFNSAFLWQRGDTTDLGIGHAFLWENGVMTDLGMLGPDGSIATGINDRGQVIGHSFFGGDTHPFIWERGAVTDLPTLSGLRSEALDINNRGQIVGASSLPVVVPHAVLWEKSR